MNTANIMYSWIIPFGKKILLPPGGIIAISPLPAKCFLIYDLLTNSVIYIDKLKKGMIMGYRTLSAWRMTAGNRDDIRETEGIFLIGSDGKTQIKSGEIFMGKYWLLMK